MSKIRHPKKSASDVEYSTFDGRLIECRKSDIRRRALRMSNIRHSTDGWSNVEYSTFNGGQYRIENRIESVCTPLFETKLVFSKFKKPLKLDFYAYFITFRDNEVNLTQSHPIILLWSHTLDSSLRISNFKRLFSNSTIPKTPAHQFLWKLYG